MRGTVHIDARDSCGLPRYTGGDAWQANLTDASGIPAHIESIRDLGDGTYRVVLIPQSSGWHVLIAAADAADAISPDLGTFSARLYVYP